MFPAIALVLTSAKRLALKELEFPSLKTNGDDGSPAPKTNIARRRIAVKLKTIGIIGRRVRMSITFVAIFTYRKRERAQLQAPSVTLSRVRLALAKPCNHLCRNFDKNPSVCVDTFAGARSPT
jgi:hypothetical protein